MAGRGHCVTVLASAACRAAAERAGHDVVAYRRAPDPDARVAFERQAARMTATAAGVDVARDVHDVLAAACADLAVVDCMLPAAAAGGRAAGVPTASLVHFLYGLARTQMLRRGGAWTTDLATLRATHRAVGVEVPHDGLTAWEAAEVVLVTAPLWLDVDLEYPPHVVHAGPLGVRRRAPAEGRAEDERAAVLLSFSTTVMDGQPEAVQRICDGVARAGVRAILTLGPAIDRAWLRIPENVEVRAWADHDELLPACAAVVGHGGLGTTMRALAHGVPLVILPLGRDQGVNAARVAALGAGIALPPEAGAGDVCAALHAVLSEPRYAAAAASVAERMADDDADTRAADTLERCAQRATPPGSGAR
jgi:MGT family glycosyltransferase